LKLKTRPNELFLRRKSWSTNPPLEICKSANAGCEKTTRRRNEFLIAAKEESTMEGRVIEYRPGCGLDYHNSPLIGEIPTGDYTHFHRSIDQLRSLGACTTMNGGTPTTTTTITTNGLIEYNPHLQAHPYHKENHLNVIVAINHEEPNGAQMIDDRMNNNHVRGANEHPVGAEVVEMKHYIVEKTEQMSTPTSPCSNGRPNNQSAPAMDDIKDPKVMCGHEGCDNYSKKRHWRVK
jgi:hypothetical protein